MKKLLGMILVLALVFSMAACSRGGEYVPTGDALAPEEGGSTPVTRPTDGEQMQDLTLTYYAEESMNPILSTNYTNRALFSLLYQSLFLGIPVFLGSIVIRIVSCPFICKCRRF